MSHQMTTKIANIYEKNGDLNEDRSNNTKSKSLASNNSNTDNESLIYGNAFKADTFCSQDNTLVTALDLLHEESLTIEYEKTVK